MNAHSGFGEVFVRRFERTQHAYKILLQDDPLTKDFDPLVATIQEPLLMLYFLESAWVTAVIETSQRRAGSSTTAASQASESEASLAGI